MDNTRQDVNDSQDSSGWQQMDLDSVNTDVEIEIVEQEPQKVEPVRQKDETPEFVLDEPQEEVQVEVEGEEAQDEGKQPTQQNENTSRAQKRIRQLLDREKQKDLELMQLRQQLQEASEKATKHREAEATVRTNSVKNSIDSYKKELARAVTEGDVAAQVELQDKLSKANVELMALESLPATKAPEKRDVQPRQQEQITRERVMEALPEAGRKWAEQNKWFLVNDVLTQAALSVSKEVEAEGFSTEEPEYYEEVQKRMAEMYPARFAKKEPEKKVVAQPKVQAKPIVAASKTVPSSKAGAVRLTKEDVAYANKWGIPLKAYAEEKKKIEQSEKAGSLTTAIFGE